MKKHTKIILGLLMVFTILFASSASVSAFQGTFSNNLSLGATGSDVVGLQDFLEKEGYLVMPLGVQKGNFGPLTRSAVAKWQLNHGIFPSVGFFGPKSRQALNEISQLNLSASKFACADMNGDGKVTQEDVDYIKARSGLTPAKFADGDVNGNNTVNATDISIAKAQLGTTCNMTDPFESLPTQTSSPTIQSIGTSHPQAINVNSSVVPPSLPSPTIYSITPSSGATGATVTVKGVNFGATNYLRLDGGLGPSFSSADGKTLTITIPESLSNPACDPFRPTACPNDLRIVTPGNYSLTIQNSNGKSNAYNFTVNSQAPAPMICADMNGDGKVTQEDVDYIKARSGLTPAKFADGDVNGNNTVNATDISIAKAQLGTTCNMTDPFEGATQEMKSASIIKTISHLLNSVSGNMTASAKEAIASLIDQLR
jgi:peptidoglycan hydrolase-like protein with peptidoglycan-binding domain